MLYNPKWSILERSNIKAWLKTKNPEGRYPYEDCTGKCMYSRYLTDHGYPRNPLDPLTWPIFDALHTKFGGIAHEKPHTYGAALARLEAGVR